jgi:hypothetical protein
MVVCCGLEGAPEAVFAGEQFLPPVARLRESLQSKLKHQGRTTSRKNDVIMKRTTLAGMRDRQRTNLAPRDYVP